MLLPIKKSTAVISTALVSVLAVGYYLYIHNSFVTGINLIKAQKYEEACSVLWLPAFHRYESALRFYCMACIGSAKDYSEIRRVQQKLKQFSEQERAELYYDLGVLLHNNKDAKISKIGKDWIVKSAIMGNKIAKEYLLRLPVHNAQSIREFAQSIREFIREFM